MPSGAPVALSAGAALSAAFVAGTWAVRGRSSSVFAPSIHRATISRKALALTFDDGPSPATPLLLDILARHSIPATFFQVGENAEAYPALARQVAEGGHEIGNHSSTHPNFAFTRPSFALEEFSRAQTVLADITGKTPIWLRAPYGVRWFGFREAQRKLNLTGVMWSVIGRDWRLPASAVTARILNHVSQGDIICLHDGRGTLKNPDVEATLEAVRRIIPELLGRGYHFETVSDLLMPEELTPPNHQLNGDDLLTPRVLRIIAETQRKDPAQVTIDSSFEELGIDSMDGVNIIFALENEFDINVPDEEVKNIRSVRDMVEGVRNLVQTKDTVAGDAPPAN